MTRSTLYSLFVLGLFSLCMLPNLYAKDAAKNGHNGVKQSQKGAEPKGKLEKHTKGKEKNEETRETYTVHTQPLEIEQTLEGYFVATEMAEISLWPESWSDFKITNIVAHGAEVQQGEVILQFEDQGLNKAITDLDLDLHLSELKIDRFEEELPRQERSLTRKLADAEEALRRAKEDFQRYRETEREQTIDSANMRLKTAKFNLDYYKDELEQLEKMYEADDLTEETEEIVLRRQKFYVESGELNFELSKYFHDRTLNVSIPRTDRDMEESLKTAEEQVENAEIANQIDVSQARYELEKLKSARKASLDKHVKLLADRDLMTIKSPMTGVVYYGEATDGKWSKIVDMRQKLIPGKSVVQQSVLMTVLDTSQLQVMILLDEKLRIALKTGQKVEVQPTVEGSEPLTGKVASISAMPVADGKFDLRVELTDDLPEWLVPGMSCKVKVVTYFNEDALLVPKQAVHQGDGADKEYVWIVQDGEAEKKQVKTGRSKGENIEITSGLDAGDVVSLEDQKQED